MGAAEEIQSGGRTLRADAQRNRERIVEAARSVFAEKGLDVPWEDIADRAGVGIATLYRRFPTREELIAAVFEDKLREYAVAAEEALKHPDPWTGFCAYIERICGMQASDRGFTDVITMALPASETAQQVRDLAYRAAVELIERAQESGGLREDFVPEDIFVLLMANAGLVHATREAAPHAWRRLVAYLLEGFRADRTGPLPAAPTPAQTRRVMLGNAAVKRV
ncbi:TetR/AcrR family transcriptional regulator [Streptomyces sp. bgisy027]|uniref:TetR/AcrR family transcriptional regulator n=1 Tax=unclassified Streptomyces TaxID=2593676 RepID=UPI003D747135